MSDVVYIGEAKVRDTMTHEQHMVFWEFKFFHEGLRPFGQPIPIQCPNSRCLAVRTHGFLNKTLEGVDITCDYCTHVMAPIRQNMENSKLIKERVGEGLVGKWYGWQRRL